MNTPTEQEFRDIGYTIHALKYPLTEGAIRILCFENGLKLSQVTKAWYYASNEACQRRLENLALSPIYAIARTNT